MARKQVPPAAVTDRGGAGGGVDDVGEHDGQQCARELATAAPAGEEFLDLFDDCLAVTDEGEGVLALELHVAGAGDVRGQVARMAHVPDVLVGPVHDQRGDTDAR